MKSLAMVECLVTCGFLHCSRPISSYLRRGVCHEEAFTLKVTRKVKTCRQTKEEAGDARSDNETVARGTQDGRFTENLVNISLTLALV